MKGSVRRFIINSKSRAWIHLCFCSATRYYYGPDQYCPRGFNPGPRKPLFHASEVFAVTGKWPLVNISTCE